jgi:transcriptional regulator with XRE-family HTH domain
VTPVERSPTVRRRRLAKQLAELRELAGLTVRDVARELEWAESTLYRIESARRGVKPGDVLLLLELFTRSSEVVITQEQRDELLRLAREARKRGWWQTYSGAVAEPFVVYIGLEAEVSTLRAYAGELVPGLLQTEQYAREIRRASLSPADPEQTERWTALRMARQRRLTEEEPVRLWAVLNEAALHRTIGGPKVMTDQLTRLADASALPNVTLQVLPFSVGAHPAMDSPFMILGFPERSDEDVVYIEQMSQAMYVETAAEVDWYTLAFDHLRARALDPDESLARIVAVRNNISPD